MSDGDQSHLDYVLRVREQTRRYIDELIADNQRLSGELALHQQQHLETLARLDEKSSETEQLRQRIDEVEQERERFFRDYASVEEQNNNLANLYIATYSLHGTLERRELLSIVQEIIINLIGSEECAVLERDPISGRTLVSSQTGIDAAELERALAPEGFLGARLRSGEGFLETTGGSGAALEQRLTAFVPMRVQGAVTGAIAIFSLLPQKPGLEAIDRELLELLARQASMALFCSSLFDRQKGDGSR